MKLLRVDNLSIEIAKEEKLIDGSFSVESGDVLLLTGPNGSGKSTILKILMGDLFDYKKLKYRCMNAIFFDGEKELYFSKNQNDMETFRQLVCYVSQDDEFDSDSVLDCFSSSLANYNIQGKEIYAYDFVKKYEIYNAFYMDENVKLDLGCRMVAKKLGLRLHKLTLEEKKAIKFLAMNVKKMSGGQRKLTNIVTNLVRYEFCKLVIMDEPLNNLDYGNVRAFSNILTKIYKDKPELGMIIVTHCRSLPIINMVMEIDVKSKTLVPGSGYQCNSCFGRVNSEFLYE